MRQPRIPASDDSSSNHKPAKLDNGSSGGGSNLLPDLHTQGHVRAIIRRRDFRDLLATRLTSQLADGFFQASLAVSVFFNPTQQVEPMAYAVAFAMLVAPYSILGPYVGVFLDRWSRRSILAISNMVRAIFVIPAAILIWAQAPEISFGIFALLVITINRFVLSGLSAAQPHVVERPHLVTANAFAVTAGTISYGLGLAGAYVVIQVVGDGSNNYAAAAAVAVPMYALSAVIAWFRFKPMQLGPDETERRTDHIIAAIIDISKGMVQGFRHLWDRRGAFYSMAVQAGHRALYGVLTVTTLAVFREYFHSVDYPQYQDTLGWLAGIAAAGQIGSFASALITPRITRWIGPARWVTGLMALVCVTVAVVGFGMVEIAFVIATAFINVASQGTKIVVDTSLQLRCDDEYRGRLFSLNDTVFNLSFIVGMFVGASVLPHDGYAPYLFFFISGGYVILTSWYASVSRRHAPY